MRLVDADMITLYLIVEGQNHRDKYGFSLGDTIKFSPSEVKKIIQKMPTIEERKRGEWIPLGVRHGWICSKCRKENVYAFRSDDNGEYVLQDYFCPHCGADMRGVEE